MDEQSAFGREFGNNLIRLLGLHQVPAVAGRHLFHLSPQAISDLRYGKRQPSLRTASSVSEFFEIPIDRLLNAPFEELLETDLSKAERFRKVERKIAKVRKTLPSTTRRSTWMSPEERGDRPDPSAPA